MPDHNVFGPFQGHSEILYCTCKPAHGTGHARPAHSTRLSWTGLLPKPSTVTSYGSRGGPEPANKAQSVPQSRRVSLALHRTGKPLRLFRLQAESGIERIEPPSQHILSHRYYSWCELSVDKALLYHVANEQGQEKFPFLSVFPGGRSLASFLFLFFFLTA